MRVAQQDRTWSPVAEGYAAGLFLAYVFFLFLHSAPPSLTNYADWTYQGILLKELLLGHSDLWHRLKPYPVPNSTVTIGIGLLSLVLPWVLAAKVWLSVQLAISFFCLRHLLRTIGSGSAPWIILPQAAFLNVSFWYGFMNFDFGLCWVLLIASLLLRQLRAHKQTWIDEVGIGGVLLLAFFTHMIPFAFAALLVVLYAVQTRRWRIIWPLLPSMLLTLWYVLGRYMVSENADAAIGLVPTARAYSGMFWATKLHALLKSFGFVNLVTADHSIDIALWGRTLFVLLILANLLLCAILSWRMIAAFLKADRSATPDRFLWTAILLVIPVYLLVPGAALGVSDPGSRVLQVALCVGLILGVSQWSDCSLRRITFLCSGILGIAGVYLFNAVAMTPQNISGRGMILPAAIIGFAQVPVYDQDRYYRALESGDRRLAVFPTGMFVNTNLKPLR